MRLLVIVFMLAAFGALGAIIPSDRLADWADSGVSGGIPDTDAMTVFTNIPSGSSASYIQNALNACTSNKVVLLAAGSYSFSSTRLDW